jgi:hypothetical protein
MNISDLVIATITMARNLPEETLLRASLTKLAALNIPVYVTDGGSGPEFVEFLRILPNFTLLTTDAKGVWAQARTSVLAASADQKPFILYTEPDKADFFQQHLPTFIANAPVGKEVGVVLASRLAAGFNTFPAFQQTTETTINQCISEVTGQAGDYTYGPFIFNRELGSYLEWVQEDIGWGWRPYVFGLAHRLGFTLTHLEGDYLCPPDQRADNANERLYRMRQMVQNIQGLLLSPTVNI